VTATAPAPLRFAADPPGDLQFLVDFVNTRPIGQRPDCFHDAAIAEDYLHLCGLDVSVTSASIGGIRQLRDAVADAIGSDPGDGEHAYDWRTINALAAKTPLIVRFETGPTATLTGDDVVAHVLADIQRAIAAGKWSRLHLCANDVCRVAFYDTSRSRTQRWHSYETCGNRANVAAHRARKS
jgi:predicted RNA-binding Zn ribbon-like protein